MSLQAIVDKIKVDTEEEVQAILSEAEKRCLEIKEETKKQVESIEMSLRSKVKKMQNQEETVARSLEKQRASLSKQEAKRKILDSVYEEALAEILSLPKEEYVNILVNKYKTIITEDKDFVEILSPENRKLETESIMNILGIKAKITPSNKIKGGCILVGKDFEFDLSIEHLFSKERITSEIEIAKVLFG